MNTTATNSNAKTWADYALWVLLAIGFYGAITVSYANLTGSPCPHIVSIPICYAVLIGYGLMVLSVIIWHNGCRHYFFAVGWAIAGSIALIGSVAEIASGGGVCPTSGGGGSIRGAASSGAVPLCYVSLALVVAILILFILGPYRRSVRITDEKLKAA